MEEDGPLFWHHVFATGTSKVDNCDQMNEQIDMFREHGLGNYHVMLLKLAKKSGRDFLAGRQRKSPGRGQRELGQGVARAVLHGSRQLHRDRCAGSLPGIHRMDHNPQVTTLTLRPVLMEFSNTERKTTTTPRRYSWGSLATSTARISLTS